MGGRMNERLMNERRFEDYSWKISPIWDTLMTARFAATNWPRRVQKWPSLSDSPTCLCPFPSIFLPSVRTLCFVFLLSVFFLPPDGAVSSILKALGVCRLLFLVLLYTMRIFMFNKWVPKVPRSTNVNGMCWTNSLKYYSSKMKK